MATALFYSGSSIGGALAPFLVLTVYFRWGWRPAFVLPGLLGFLWLIVWRRTYHTPQEHPHISEAERQMILADVHNPDAKTSRPKPGWAALLKIPQTWGAARKALVVFGGCGVLLLIPTVFTFKLWAIVVLFALATFSYAAFSTIANVLPSDLFASESVASVSSMSGTERESARSSRSS